MHQTARDTKTIAHAAGDAQALGLNSHNQAGANVLNCLQGSRNERKEIFDRVAWGTEPTTPNPRFERFC